MALKQEKHDLVELTKPLQESNRRGGLIADGYIGGT